MKKYAKIVDAIQIDEDFKEVPTVFKDCCLISFDDELDTFRVEVERGPIVCAFADLGDYVVDDGEKIFVMRKNDFEERFEKYAD